MRKHHLTPRSRAHLAEWRDMWVARTISMEPMSAEECAIADRAVRGLYVAAKLPEPRAVIVVRDPAIATIAAGIAAAVWHLREHPEEPEVLGAQPLSDDDLLAVAELACVTAVRATQEALPGTPMSADEAWAAVAAATAGPAAPTAASILRSPWLPNDTRIATYRATCRAALDSMRDAISASAWDTLDGALGGGISRSTRGRRRAVRHAVRAAGEAAWRTVVRPNASPACAIPHMLGLAVGSAYGRLAHGGNLLAGSAALVSFGRDVMGLPVAASWAHYEALAIHSGPRLMHPKFCVVSDRRH